MSDLPDNKYLIEALAAFGYSTSPNAIADVKRMPMGYSDIIAHARALECIAELEGCLNEAVARLAKHEPPVDPDLVLAREIAARWWRERSAPKEAEATICGDRDDSTAVQCALAGIKAGRAGGGV